MKNKIEPIKKIVFLSFMIVLAATSLFAAENHFKQGWIGWSIRPIFIDLQKETEGNIDYYFDDCKLFGVNILYFINSNISLDFNVSYLLNSDIDFRTSGLNVNNLLEYESIPINLSTHYHFKINDYVYPYLGLGVSYYFNDLDNEYFNIDDSFGYNINTGIEILDSSTKVSFNMEIQYINTNTDIDLIGYSLFEMKINGFVSSIGFNFYY